MMSSQYMHIKESNSVQKDFDQSPQMIVFGGYGDRTQFKKTLTKIENVYIFYNPLNFIINHPIQSISVFNDHSVIVTHDGLLFAVGNNADGIWGPYKKEIIKEFTEITIIKDGHQLFPLSAVCTTYGTLYSFIKKGSNEKQLVYCDFEINKGEPIYLNICNQQPIALFGGHYHTAAITDKGEIIFINRFAVKESPNLPIKAIALPNGEKASFIACGNKLVFVLSSSGLVFSSKIDEKNNMSNFQIVKELENIEIVCLSGTYEHFIAVAKNGTVYGFGRNCCGELGLGNTDKVDSNFIKIPTFNNYLIEAGYAGTCFSLFKTNKGKILSCGHDNHGQLLKESQCENNELLPTDTLINSRATFCIAANVLSLVFIEKPPPINTPNMRITMP